MNELFYAKPQLLKQKSPGFIPVGCRHKDIGLSSRPLVPGIQPSNGAPTRTEGGAVERRYLDEMCNDRESCKDIETPCPVYLLPSNTIFSSDRISGSSSVCLVCVCDF